MKLILKHINILEEFIEEDIKQVTNKKIKKLDKKHYEIDFKDDKELFQTFYDIAFYSRTVEKIYLLDDNSYDKVLDKKKEFLAFKLLIELNGKKTKVYDLSGTILESRSYMLNKDIEHLSHNITNYILFRLGFHKLKNNFTLADPIANYGSLIVESSLFNPRKPLHVKQRSQFPISKVFENRISLPKPIKDKNKYIAICQDNLEFKKCKENINFSSQKIKLSKYELDMFDVKYEENSIDYIISTFPISYSKEEFVEFQKEFFYRSEYVFKKRIIVITKEKIDLKIPKKYKLKLEKEEKIRYGLLDYHIYIFK